MGQKVNPIGFRVGFNRAWRSMWYASKKDFPIYLYEDAMIRKFIKKKLEGAAVSKVTIERAANRVRVNIHTARPGVVIGRKAAELDKLKDEIRAITTKDREILVDVKEIKNPELDAQLVAENIALQLYVYLFHEESRPDYHGHGWCRRYPRPLLRSSRRR